MDAVNDRPKPLYSKTIRPGGKLFYFDVYPSRTGGEPYLSIVENRKNKEGGLDRIRMFVNRDGMQDFRDALNEVEEFFEGYRPGHVWEDELSRIEAVTAARARAVTVSPDLSDTPAIRSIVARP